MAMYSAAVVGAMPFGLIAEDSAGMQREFQNLLDGVFWFLVKLAWLSLAVTIVPAVIAGFVLLRYLRKQQAAKAREDWVAAAVAKLQEDPKLPKRGLPTAAGPDSLADPAREHRQRADDAG